MKRLYRDNVAFAYEDVGSGSQPFLFVHGWTCNHNFFAPQIEYFSRFHRVIAVDLCGHGASDAPQRQYTVPEFADDLAWLCGELGVERAVLVGHSMGGVIALQLAATHPELSAAVCLIDSDSPTVPPENFSKAIEFLKTRSDRIVLGPCDDGGYYLIGVKKPHRELFERIDWSTERVFDQTMRRARELGLEVKFLPPGYDIDDAAGLHRLYNELQRDSVHTEIAPHTRKFMRQLIVQKK